MPLAEKATGNAGTDGAEGYLPGNLYTFMMQLTRNDLGGLDIEASMSGGNIDNDGLMSVATTDATPSPLGGYQFDTFVIRPDGNDRAHNIIDTSLFRVEYLPAVPEPASLWLLMLGLGLVAGQSRRR